MKIKNLIIVCALAISAATYATNHGLLPISGEFLSGNSFVKLNSNSVKQLTVPARAAYKNAETKVQEYNGIESNTEKITSVELYGYELAQFIDQLNFRFPGDSTATIVGIALDDGAPFADE